MMTHLGKRLELTQMWQSKVRVKAKGLGGGRENGDWHFNGSGVSFGGDENVLELW